MSWSSEKHKTNSKLLSLVRLIKSKSNSINGLGRIYPTLTAISPTPTLHLALFQASSFFKPTLLLSISTCIFHVFFDHPPFLLPFTSNSNAFLKTCSSSLNTSHAHTISLYSPLPSESLFPSIPTSPLGPLSSFSPSVLHHQSVLHHRV